MKAISQNEKVQTLKSKLKSYAKTRVGFSVCAWVVGLTISLVLGLPLAFISKTWELCVMVFITTILSICSLISIFARYVDSKMFPPSAFFQVGMILFFSLQSIGLLAIDLSFTLQYRGYDDYEQLQRIQTFVTILWNIIYWGSMLFGSVLNQFFTRYWQSGHFSVCDRVKHVIKGLLIRMIAGGIAVVSVFVLVFVILQVRDISGVKAVALILSNVINMLQLVILLAYGLFNIPIYLWKKADNKQTLYNELERAENVRMEYRSALADFYTVINQCRNMIANYRTGHNTAYMDILDQELPKRDLDGTAIGFSTNFKLDLAPGQDVSEDYIANVRYQFRVSYFLYKRKKSRWVNMYQKINSLIELPVNYEESYLKKNLDNKEELPTLDQMCLKPKPNDKRNITLLRVASMLSLVFCLFILATEATVIYDPQYTLMYLILEDHMTWKYRNWMFSIVFLASMVAVCFFTIFNSRFSDFLQLVPRHTDCLQLSSVVSMCCKIITVACFNYMVILGEVAPGMEEYQYGTCYADFYSSMIKVPFLGSNFNRIMPMFILVFGAVFAVFSLFSLKSKTLTALKNFTKKNIVEEGADVKDDPKAAPTVFKKVKKDEESQNEKEDAANAEQQSIVQRILKGERAILLEIDIGRKKEERMKLLRFNNLSAVDALNAQKQQDIKNQAKSDAAGTAIELADKSSSKTKQLTDTSKPALTNSKIRSVADILAENNNDKKTPLLFGSNKPAPVTSTISSGKPPIKGSARMQYGIFRKAKVIEEDQDEDNITHQNDELLQPTIKQNRQLEDDDDKKPLKNKKPAQKGWKKMQMDVDEDEISEEEKVSKPKAVKGGQKKSFHKEGWLYKKKGKIMTTWNKRYVVIDNQFIRLYEDKSKKNLRKELDMTTGNVQWIGFHYDDKAPKLSKRIDIKEKDDSRFDIYIRKPIPRAFMMRVDEGNVWEAEDWVNTFQEALKCYGPKKDEED